MKVVAAYKFGAKENCYFVLHIDSNCFIFISVPGLRQPQPTQKFLRLHCTISDVPIPKRMTTSNVAVFINQYDNTTTINSGLASHEFRSLTNTFKPMPINRKKMSSSSSYDRYHHVTDSYSNSSQTNYTFDLKYVNEQHHK